MLRPGVVNLQFFARVSLERVSLALLFNVQSVRPCRVGFTKPQIQRASSPDELPVYSSILHFLHAPTSLLTALVRCRSQQICHSFLCCALSHSKSGRCRCVGRSQAGDAVAAHHLRLPLSFLPPGTLPCIFFLCYLSSRHGQQREHLR